MHGIGDRIGSKGIRRCEQGQPNNACFDQVMFLGWVGRLRIVIPMIELAENLVAKNKIQHICKDMPYVPDDKRNDGLGEIRGYLSVPEVGCYK